MIIMVMHNSFHRKKTVFNCYLFLFLFMFNFTHFWKPYFADIPSRFKSATNDIEAMSRNVVFFFLRFRIWDRLDVIFIFLYFSWAQSQCHRLSFLPSQWGQCQLSRSRWKLFLRESSLWVSSANRMSSSESLAEDADKGTRLDSGMSFSALKPYHRDLKTTRNRAYLNMSIHGNTNTSTKI